MKAIVLAAGEGTRLKPITETISKVMIPVANKPLLEWTVDALRSIVNEVLIVVRKDQADILDYFADTPKVRFVFQGQAKGTAHAIQCCEQYITDKFMVLNGDDLRSEEDLEKLSKLDGMWQGVFYSDHPEDFGVVKIENGLVKGTLEKPKSPESNIISTGVFLFDKRLFDYIRKIKPTERGEYELPDAVNLMIKDGIEFRPFVLSEYVGISYPWNILDANKMMLDKIGTQIGRNVKVRPGAFIEEPVAIGDGTIVGPNCFIRKYSVIGKNCRIGNAVEIKNSTIMNNTYVSHLSYVGDSIVGNNCNIGAGCIFANLKLEHKTIPVNIKEQRIDSKRKKLGAIIADNVNFGVNVTIMPGKMIWPNINIPPCTLIANDIKEQPTIDLEKRVL
jgi:bifunctional UDP-N-acetylglucosamine pyrophosphorylase/glucosamine-1-phosphate N-acetyltransferase